MWSLLPCRCNPCHRRCRIDHDKISESGLFRNWFRTMFAHCNPFRILGAPARFRLASHQGELPWHPRPHHWRGCLRSLGPTVSCAHHAAIELVAVEELRVVVFLHINIVDPPPARLLFAPGSIWASMCNTPRFPANETRALIIRHLAPRASISGMFR